MTKMNNSQTNFSFELSDGLKICSVCNELKSIDNFYKRRDRKIGTYSRCKACESKRCAKDRKKNDRYYWKKNRNKWVEFFKEKYGDPPNCQCCGKELNWDINSPQGDKVYFDHRNGGSESIKSQPMAWVGKNKLNDENLAIFFECDFGILCITCNITLPTKNREEWIKNVINYMGRENDR